MANNFYAISSLNPINEEFYTLPENQPTKINLPQNDFLFKAPALINPLLPSNHNLLPSNHNLKRSRASLPLPDFSPVPLPDLASAEEPNKKQKIEWRTPPTPRKPKKLSPIAQEFLSCHRLLQSGRLKYENHEYKVKAIDGARGEFKQAYEVIDTQNIYKNFSNDQLIVKAFHDLRINKSPARLGEFKKTSLKQYEILTELGLAVAKWLNKETAIKDQFDIFERIPHAVNLKPWASKKNIHKKFEELEESDQKILKQFKIFLNTSVEKMFEIDLLPQNFRLNDKGILHLIDLTDEKVEIVNLNDLAVEILQKLELWSKGNSSIYDYLSQDFKTINKKFDNALEVCKKDKETTEERFRQAGF